MDYILPIKQIFWSSITQVNHELRDTFDSLPCLLCLLWRVSYPVCDREYGYDGFTSISLWYVCQPLLVLTVVEVGYFVPDIVVAVLVGLVTRWYVGPLIPVVGFRKKKRSHLKKITGFEFAPGSSSEVLITSADSRI